ncbi:hypothetical protein FGADI_7074 [Fusarium gaditjirri]|uniref:NWD NACHT-NTPase N-terminal domain-containing protein n=1 Tax=Fusarium gaditjirri TaxID=282569 RepID=A0A8H4T624_9HYPO|nr:hypothetical protein FGADI_7074 [Fusarium gaditjirri]
MTSPETTDVQGKPDVPQSRLKQLGRKVKIKMTRPRSRKQKSRPSSSNRPSRVSTFSDPATHKALPRRPTMIGNKKNSPRTISPTDSPPSESRDKVEQSKEASVSESNDAVSRPANASLWAQAYREAKNDPKFVKLLESYKEFLAKRYGLSENESAELLKSFLNPTSQREDSPIQKIAQKALDDLESTRLTFRVGDRKIVIREQVKKILDFLTNFKSVIGAAAAAEPSASLAWTGVMAALPFLENIVKQDESAAQGFERISFVMVRYALLEKDLLHEKSETSMSVSVEHSRVIESIKDRVIKVYAIVYEYQIRIVLQYAHGKPRRMIGDLVLHNDWKKMSTDIEEKDREIDRAVNTATHSSLRDELKRVDRSIRDAMSKVVELHKEISAKMDISILDRIPYVENAVFDSGVVGKQEGCLFGTQYDALSTIQAWAESPDGEPIFWLAGMAGTGKSTIAVTVARCLQSRETFFDRKPGLDDRTFLGATFFISREDPSRNTVKHVFPTIAKTLAVSFPDLREQISQNIYRDTTVGFKQLVEQMRNLISEPLDIVSKALLVTVRLIIIIDSVDECELSSEAQDLLRLLPSLGKFRLLDVRVLVVSRPEKYISEILDHEDFGVRVKKYFLEKIPRQIDDSDPDDITKFMQSRLEDITKRRQFAEGWCTNDAMSQLVERAGGLFIYAATTWRFLDATDDDEIQESRLQRLIEGTTGHGTPEARLDEIYLKVLMFPTREMSEDEKKVTFSKYRCILGIIALAFEPLSAVTIENLMPRKKSIRKTLEDFGSILEVPSDDQSPVSFHHLSFRDFLLSEERCGNEFSIDVPRVHTELFLKCLSILNESLHQDMCGLVHPGTLASDISKRRVNERIPQHTRYACLYWSRHLSKLSDFKPLSANLDDAGDVYKFLSTKFLHWLEVLSLLGEYHRAITVIEHLQSLSKPATSPKLSSFLQDAYRFVLSNTDTITQAPLQTYCSALIFSPTKSIIRARFLNLIPSWIARYPDWRDEWGSELMVLNERSYQFDISRDGETLVSADFQGTTTVWDITTGFETAKFHYPSKALHIVICRDKGETIITGTNMRFESIVASPTQDILASMSGDYTIQLWDLKSFKIMKQITFDEGAYSAFMPLVFSPCGQVLVAGCGNATPGGILMWNIKDQVERKILKHKKVVTAIAISPDGERVASSDRGESLKVWSKSTEDTQSEIEIEGFVLSIAWHPHKLWMLALGISRSSIQLCNIASAQAQMIRHIDLPGIVTVPGRGLAFSGRHSILASGDFSGYIRLWDAEIASPVIARKSIIRSIYFLSGDENTVLVVSQTSAEILDLVTGTRRIFHTDIRKVACSTAQDLFAFCLKNNTIQFWDGTLANLIGTFSEFTDVFFAKSNTLVVLLSHNKALLLENHTLNFRLQIDLPGEWVPDSGPIFTSQAIGLVTKSVEKGSEEIWLFRSDNGEVVPGFPHFTILSDSERRWTKQRVFMSPDGQLMIYKTTDENNCICFVVVKVEAGYKKAFLSVGGERICTSPEFSPTASHMMLGTHSGTIWMWDMKTMALVKQLTTGDHEITEIHCCTEERITVTILSNQELENQLWDVEKGQLLQKLKADKDYQLPSLFSNAKPEDQHFSFKEGWLPFPRGDNTAICSHLARRDPFLLDAQGGWIWQGNDRLLRLPPEFMALDFGLRVKARSGKGSAARVGRSMSLVIVLISPPLVSGFYVISLVTAISATFVF